MLQLFTHYGFWKIKFNFCEENKLLILLNYILCVSYGIYINL